MDTLKKYTDLDAKLDWLYSLGDGTPAQRARIAVVLWDMVQLDQAGGEWYGEEDRRNYRSAAAAGARYLAERGLGLEPGADELAAFDAAYV